MKLIRPYVECWFDHFHRSIHMSNINNNRCANYINIMKLLSAKLCRWQNELISRLMFGLMYRTFLNSICLVQERFISSILTICLKSKTRYPVQFQPIRLSSCVFYEEENQISRSKSEQKNVLNISVTLFYRHYIQNCYFGRINKLKR